jgi:hypothetical protein
VLNHDSVESEVNEDNVVEAPEVPPVIVSVAVKLSIGTITVIVVLDGKAVIVVVDPDVPPVIVSPTLKDELLLTVKVIVLSDKLAGL